jgi:hypothetical protein
MIWHKRIVIKGEWLEWISICGQGTALRWKKTVWDLRDALGMTPMILRPR